MAGTHMEEKGSSSASWARGESAGLLFCRFIDRHVNNSSYKLAERGRERQNIQHGFRVTLLCSRHENWLLAFNIHPLPLWNCKFN